MPESDLSFELPEPAAQVVQAVRDHAPIIADNLWRVGKQFEGAIRTSMQQKPATTIAKAVAFGFIVGVLWKA